MRFIPILVLILASVSFSDSATQTDWSGGGGVPGPVTDWSDNYDTAAQINDTGGSLRLASAILANPVEHTVDDDFYGGASVYAADVDGDGDTDVLGAALGDEIAWWENLDGTGTVWTKHTVDDSFNGATSVYAADVDGDGDTDVLGAAYIADDITWWENTDGTGNVWTEHTVDGDFDKALSVYASDVDGDGDVDVLGAAMDADDITWWENTDGTGTVWTEHTVDGDFEGASSVYATDVDGDGYTDVLGAAFYADDITWWRNMNGTGTEWVWHTVDGDFDAAISIYATDVDGDGDVDVLGTAFYDADITWWENTDGTGNVWTEHTLDDSFNYARSVYAADLDGDGDIDVLGAAENANDIIWWENTDGIGTEWTEHIVDSDFDGANSVYAADVDGDGNTDILGTGNGVHEVTWWDVMGFPPAGALESSILDADMVGGWELFVSSEQEPTGTSVGFQFRSSDDYSSMGAWSDTVFTASIDLSGILADLTDFVQYRVILQTTDLSNTPVLNDVTISYTTNTGIGDNNTSWDLAPASNPSFGSFAVQVSVPQAAMVDLLLYDVTGRLIAQQSQELPGGEHSVTFNNLHEGVYFCTMYAGDFTATERIIVLKQPFVTIDITAPGACKQVWCPPQLFWCYRALRVQCNS